MGSLPAEKTLPAGGSGPGTERPSFLQHILRVISCHLHSKLWSELYDQLFHHSSEKERPRQRQTQSSHVVRPHLSSPKLALRSGSCLIGTSGFVHQGQHTCCLSPLWSTETKPRGDTSGQGATGEPFLPTTPSRCCGREGCVSQVTALSSAHRTRRHSTCGTCLQIPGSARLPAASRSAPPSRRQQRREKPRVQLGRVEGPLCDLWEEGKV